MSGNTTKPRSVDVKPRGAGVPVVDLVFDNRRVSVVVGRAPVVLGRGDSADVTIDNDGLSREHAKLVPSRDRVVHLVDLDSTNGTFVNGERIEMVQLRERDEVQLGPDVYGAFRYAQPGEDPHGVLGRLTDRQLHVACLVADGMTSAEVAGELGVSARTVDSHLARIFRRVGARGRAELARLVTEAGLPKLRPRGR